MEAGVKITEFPLGEIPFLAVDRLLDYKVTNLEGNRVPLFDDGFLPADRFLGEADKKKRSDSEVATALVYWYPTYIDTLYRWAMMSSDTEGTSPGSWHDFLQPVEAYWFRRIFKEAATTLDKIQSGETKLNHLDEVLIKNGKVKL
jgi:hypothetical protein